MSFEVQTSTISASDIRDRTRDQESAGRRIVWLFSWPWVDAERSQLDPYSTGLRELIDWGDDIWFLDPYAETGAALGRARSVIDRDGVTYHVRPRPQSMELEVMWRQIDDYRVDTDGRVITTTDVTDWPDEERFQILERADALAAARAEAEAETQRRAAASTGDSVGDAWRRRFREAELRLKERAAARNQRRRTVPAVGQLTSEVESVCARVNKQDSHLSAEPSVWKRPTAYWIVSSPIPRAFADINDYVMSMASGDHHAHSAVGAFVRDLRDAGLIVRMPNGFAASGTATSSEPSTLF